MKNNTYIIATLFFLLVQAGFAQKERTDANVFGHVVCTNCDEYLSFATIQVKRTTIGATTDETGHFQLINLPVGEHTIIASYIGYKPAERRVTLRKGETIEVNFELEEDALGLAEVIVTGDRNEKNRKESSTIVHTITPRLFSATQSLTLSEGLNFCSGLRMENNCQNCGFSQVRMNGMEGPYSQILINSRPVFSGLAGVYGLELIPSNMIERVEVIRGGGSALYGSNAIAGTINIILKDPVNNSYELGLNSALSGMWISDEVIPAPDHTVNFNTSLVSADNKTGMALFGFYRDRQPFDVNDDGFSDIPSLQNTTTGARLYHRFGTRDKLSADFFNIKEKRRGGDRFGYPVHVANIAEAVSHDITTGTVTYERFFREYDLFSAYVAGQRVDRGSYYGANQSFSDYGNTKDFSYTAGAQYLARLKRASVTAGVEHNATWLKDEKPGYPDIENAVIDNDTLVEIPLASTITVADQTTSATGIFAQYEITLNKLQISAGARFDHYTIIDNRQDDCRKTGDVVSPRLGFKYDLKDWLQARLSYAEGYRAPQVFDEDLHIETSGSRRVIYQNSPCLKQETSRSLMASLDFNKQAGKVYLGVLIEGFYTHLRNPFANQFEAPDETGTVVYTRINAESGATVQGALLELHVIPFAGFTIRSGFTVQSSKYEEEQEFGEKRFFRTPRDYGYLTIDWQPGARWGVSSTGNYTGEMLVPYFGPEATDADAGELRKPGRFWDMGIKVRYNIAMNGATLQLFSGIKNIFNAYQSDLDIGIDRDPGYIYGPMQPRTVYFGLRIGNNLK